MTANNESFGTFDFGLTPEEEARATRLQEEAVIVDLLFQGPCGYRAFTDEMIVELQEDYDRHRDPGRPFSFGKRLVTRAAIAGRLPDFQQSWEGSGITGGNRQTGIQGLEAFAVAQAEFDAFDWLIKATTVADFRRAKAEGKRAGYISTQNAEGIDPGLERLDALYLFGMRMLGLTYNSMNGIAGGCTERTDAGISDFGARVVARMDELGMIVDTAHSGRQTTLDACLLSKHPVVASHTAAQAVTPHDRGKSDEELQALAATGGVIGVVAVPPFLSTDDEGVTIEAMLDHIDYIATLVGWQHVGIGTDWPLTAPKWWLETLYLPMSYQMGFRPEHRLGEPNLIGFDDYRDFPNITRGLVKRGYSDEQILGILGENALRVWQDVCG